MNFCKRARHCGIIDVFTIYFRKFERHLHAKFVVLVVAFMLMQSFAFAQSGFLDGYVISNAGDTIFGKVDYLRGTRAYRQCTFKLGNSQPTTHQPGEIAGYGIKGERVFESHSVKLGGESPTTVFLEVLVRGQVSLYKMNGTYWIRKDSQELYSLVEVQTNIIVKDREVAHTTKRYIGILNMLLSDCVALRSRIQKARLNEKTLTELVEAYNKCNGGTSVVAKAKLPWTKAIVSVMGGLNVSQVEFGEEPGYEHINGGFEVFKSPVIGATADILSPRISERLSFHTGLLFTNTKYYSYHEIDYGFSFTRNYITLEFQELKIPLGVRYTFTGHKIEPYLNAGLSATIHLKSNSSWIQEVESGNVVETNEREALDLKNNQVGIWGGLGASASVNKNFAVFVELRLEQTNGVSVDPPVGPLSTVSNVQVFIGIRTR